MKEKEDKETERKKSVKLTFRVAGDSGLLLIMFTLVCGGHIHTTTTTAAATYRNEMRKTKKWERDTHSYRKHYTWATRAIHTYTCLYPLESSAIAWRLSVLYAFKCRHCRRQQPRVSHHIVSFMFRNENVMRWGVTNTRCFSMHRRARKHDKLAHIYLYYNIHKTQHRHTLVPRHRHWHTNKFIYRRRIFFIFVLAKWDERNDTPYGFSFCCWLLDLLLFLRLRLRLPTTPECRRTASLFSQQTWHTTKYSFEQMPPILFDFFLSLFIWLFYFIFFSSSPSSFVIFAFRVRVFPVWMLILAVYIGFARCACVKLVIIINNLSGCAIVLWIYYFYIGERRPAGRQHYATTTALITTNADWAGSFSRPKEIDRPIG